MRKPTGVDQLTIRSDFIAMPESPSPSVPASVNVASFGVGCFHFTWKKQPPFRFEMSIYATELKRVLQLLPNVNNVEVKHDGSEEAVDVVEGEEIPSLNAGTGVFPHPIFLEVSFDIYIPARIQNELAGEWAHRDTQTENFRVHNRYTFHGPATFVELRGPVGSTEASTAVQIVRQYLERELSRIEGHILFEYLGPTPFHADFYLEKLASLSPDLDSLFFEVDYVRTRAYDKIRFRYSEADFTTADEALGFLLDEIQNELGLYYALKAWNTRAIRSWNNLQARIQNLLDGPLNQGMLERVRSQVRGRELYEAHKAIANFEISEVFDQYALERHMKNAYSSDEDTYLDPFLQSAYESSPTFPTRQVAQMVEFLERRRSKALELLVILSASVIGGIAGAFLTLLSQS